MYPACIDSPLKCPYNRSSEFLYIIILFQIGRNEWKICPPLQSNYIVWISWGVRPTVTPPYIGQCSFHHIVMSPDCTVSNDSRFSTEGTRLLLKILTHVKVVTFLPPFCHVPCLQWTLSPASALKGSDYFNLLTHVSREWIRFVITLKVNGN